MFIRSSTTHGFVFKLSSIEHVKKRVKVLYVFFISISGTPCMYVFCFSTFRFVGLGGYLLFPYI